MAKKAHSGPSKSQLLKEHGELFLRKLKGEVTDREISLDSARLEAEGIPFEKIVEAREKVLEHFNRGGVTVG